LGDEIFASLDDERTLFGLRALSAISGSVQQILFAHHAAVVETARREFGGAADIVEFGWKRGGSVNAANLRPRRD
jgi:hypothetical protein